MEFTIWALELRLAMGGESRRALSTSEPVQVFVQIDNLFNYHYFSAAQLGPTPFDNSGNFVARPFPAVRRELSDSHFDVLRTGHSYRGLGRNSFPVLTGMQR